MAPISSCGLEQDNYGILEKGREVPLAVNVATKNISDTAELAKKHTKDISSGYTFKFA